MVQEEIKSFSTSTTIAIDASQRMMTILDALSYLTLGTNFVSKGLGKNFQAYILVPAFDLSY